MAIDFPTDFTDEEPTLLVGVNETEVPSVPAKAAVGATGLAAIAATTVQEGREAVKLQGALLSGADDPVAGDGQDGDFWLNTTSYEFFGPKAAGAWPASDTTFSRIDAAQTFTKAQIGAVYAIIDPASSDPEDIEIDLAVSNNFSLTMGGDRTFITPLNIAAGQSGIIAITNGGGDHTLSFGSGWLFPGGTPPAIATEANDITLLSYYALSTTEVVISAAAFDVQAAP